MKNKTCLEKRNDANKIWMLKVYPNRSFNKWISYEKMGIILGRNPSLNELPIWESQGGVGYLFRKDNVSYRKKQEFLSTHKL